jgi:hypothetical protein
MSHWLATDMGRYDRLGLLLERFGGAFVGVWIGAQLTRAFPPIPFWLRTLLFVFGLVMVNFASKRAKTYQRSAEQGAAQPNC